MRVIIAGGRDNWNPQDVLTAIEESSFKISEVVCGEAPGVDTMGRRWAEWNGIAVASFPADWDKYGKPAGPIRNGHMAMYGEALIAVWDGKSRGTKNMIQQAEECDLHIHIHKV